MKEYTKHLFIISFFFLFININVYPQTDFRPGYIITNQHDTITGFIDYRGDIRNCRICAFKSNESSDPVEYLPGEIFSYRFTKSKYYISKEFEIDSVKTNGFVEYIIDGIVDLYYYATNNASYYLIEQEDHTIIQLDKVNKNVRFGETSKNYVFEYKKYIGKLKYIFSQYPELFPEIDKTSLNHRSLASITKKYHEYVCDDDQCIDYTKKIQWVELNLALNAGISHSTISISDGYYFSENYNNSVSPILGVTADLILPQVSEKLSFILLAEIGISNYESFDIKDYSYQEIQITNTIDCLPLDISTGLKYTYPKGKFRPIIYAGMGFKQLLALKTIHKEVRIHEGQSVIYTNDNITFKRFLPGYAVNIGFDYYKNEARFAEFKFAYKFNERNGVDPVIGIKSLNFTFAYFLQPKTNKN
ncbi:MAG: hypothetical protein JXR31_07390 [Prolixibacteraceae bacterium]|nr:hypothetical protein [Prolixibacteraceae bacterium]